MSAELKYIQDVLGIRQVVVPEGFQPSAARLSSSAAVQDLHKLSGQEALATEAPELVFEGNLGSPVLFVFAEPFSGEPRKLLKKMAQAMKLQKFAIAAQATSENLPAALQPFTGEAVVFFGQNFSSVAETVGHKNCVTHSLRELATADEYQQQRKAQTWAALKKIMEDLNGPH